MPRLKILATLAIVSPALVSAVNLDAQNPASIRSAARIVAGNLVGYYNPAIPKLLPDPYYWWESGNLLGGLIEYWHYTGDTTYNDMATRGLMSQIGPGRDFMGPYTEGNDDQAWWALAAMSAAEYGLPSPTGSPSWISISQKVFEEFISRWDSARCNGGMKWQISPKSNGYHYKSSISNGLFFQLAGRLGRFTGKAEYVGWATRSFDWMRSTGLIDNNYNVFDGTDDAKGPNGCIDVNHDQWSYNVAAVLYGAAVLQEYTGDAKWAGHTAGLVQSAGTFFEKGVMFEPRCEKAGSCNADQLSFKAYLSRWLAGTAVLVPSTRKSIMPMLTTSATSAAAACSGGPNQAQCGSRWYTGKFDGVVGVGQQLAALEVIYGLLATNASKPRRVGGRGYIQ